jgi:hypothetical protein
MRTGRDVNRERARTRALTSIEDDKTPPTSVILETPNVAVSADPLGTVLGVQLIARNQSPLVGLRFQVVLPAKCGLKNQE